MSPSVHLAPSRRHYHWQQELMSGLCFEGDRIDNRVANILSSGVAACVSIYRSCSLEDDVDNRCSPSMPNWLQDWPVCPGAAIRRIVGWNDRRSTRQSTPFSRLHFLAFNVPRLPCCITLRIWTYYYSQRRDTVNCVHWNLLAYRISWIKVNSFKNLMVNLTKLSIN